MSLRNASGRLVATIVMLEGISSVGTVIAAITSTFVMRTRRQSPAQQALEAVPDVPIDPDSKKWPRA